MLKRLYHLQIIILAAGTVFAWYTVYQDFARFYNIEGTILKIKDCVLPNPVTTPCFYGAWAFLIGLIWAIVIAGQELAKRLQQQSQLTWLLIASTLFAWGNFAYVLMQFYSSDTGSTTGCSGVLTTNPFTTPCFIGSVIFLLALINALIIKRRPHHETGIF